VSERHSRVSAARRSKFMLGVAALANLASDDNGY